MKRVVALLLFLLSCCMFFSCGMLGNLFNVGPEDQNGPIAHDIYLDNPEIVVNDISIKVYCSELYLSSLKLWLNSS